MPMTASHPAAACLAAAVLLVACTLPAAEKPSDTVTIFRDPGCPQIVFAAGEVRAALAGCGLAAAERPLDAMPGDAAAVRILLLTQDAPAAKARLAAAGGAPAALQPQGFAIRKTAVAGGTEIAVIGGDPAGAMYGGLDLAETIRLEKGLTGAADKTAAPAIARRGIKFNIPLDARTPSYDDSGDAAQENIVHMWDFEFWRDFLDDMARARYNVLTLWNPHPFPSMVRVPEYPDLALEDVCVTTIKPTAKHGSIGEHMGVSQAVLENLRVVRKMTLGEKIEFWRRIMRHAKDRGIDVYFITWNVLTNSATGKHGITNAQDNPATIAYLRASVREFILTYPLLAGIGVTAGENMKARQDEFAKEKWLWRTYGEGVLDARKAQPGRTVPFIHRIWQTSVGDVMKDFGSKYPDPFDLGFKYAHARLYSSPAPPFARPLCDEMKPHDLKCWWNLRNDDIFVFRWGDPEFVRAFLKNLPPKEFTAGYYVGSDGYVWGREFASTEPDTPRQLEIRKHWYSFMLWGRLGYDPALDRAFFLKTLAAKFPEAKPEQIYDAWAEASRIIPLVNRFHWRDWDYMWSVEGCMDQRQGFHTVRDFITCPTMQASGLAAIPAYVEALAGGKPPPGREPLDVADELDARAVKA
ncbi:MAG: carbohydrate-binding family 6 protein, partial [Planctomycetota bacterium]|nr:carbohydrate-binding family 6 protein [Planctomycetota bacterium]